MPFKRRDDWLLPCERAANEGKEFIMPITADSVFVHWTRALHSVSEKVDGKKTDGVLVIRFHGKPIAILGSPRILRDILLEWHIPPKDTSQHAAISDGLALLADSAKPAPPQPFSPSTLGVRYRPKSINKFLHEQSELGGMVAILRFQATYAFLIPLSLLARFRQEANRQAAPEWREAKNATTWAGAVLSWLYLPDHASADSRQTELL